MANSRLSCEELEVDFGLTHARKVKILMRGDCSIEHAAESLSWRLCGCCLLLLSGKSRPIGKEGRWSSMWWVSIPAGLTKPAISILTLYMWWNDTLTDADTIAYEVTLEDAKAYTRPWKMSFTFKKRPTDFESYEYECSENENYIHTSLGSEPRLPDNEIDGSNRENLIRDCIVLFPPDVSKSSLPHAPLS